MYTQETNTTTIIMNPSVTHMATSCPLTIHPCLPQRTVSYIPRKPLIYLLFTVNLVAFPRILYNWKQSIYTLFLVCFLSYSIIILRIIHSVNMKSSFLLLLSNPLLGTSQVAELVKNSPAMQEMWV